jgi:hypothetical protein
VALKIFDRFGSVSAILTLCGGFLCGPPAAAQGLPDGPGKSDLQQVCTACHSTDQIIAKGRRTPAQWQVVVTQMTNFGATGSSAQMAAILKYLTSIYSRQPTPEEVAEESGAKSRPREPLAKLPLAEARDLSGTWMTAFWYTGLNMGPKGSLPDYDIQLHGVNDPTAPFPSLLTPWAKAISDKYTIYTDPVLFCYSPGPQDYSMPYAFEILSSPGRITMLMEAYHVVRRVYLDRPIPKDYPNPNVMGYSVGHWDGDTLVIDTVGFNESPIIRIPHSDQLHMVERIRRIRDGNVLEIEITETDPKAYTQPLRQTHFFKKDPSIEIVEHNCDGQLDYSVHIPKTAGK